MGRDNLWSEATTVKNLLLVGIGLAALGLSNVRAEDEPPAASKERIGLAKRVYRERILFGLNRRTAPPQSTAGPTEDPLLNEAMAEDLHRWSARWKAAACDVAT